MVQTFTGTASWYKPGVGYKGGTGTTASGEAYSSSGFNAAIKMSLRGSFNGVSNGRVGYALVEANGKKAIVKVNDVGPLSGHGIKRGRIIDFAERTKNYFGAEGLVHGVNVTPLPGTHKPGPVPNDATYASVMAGKTPMQVASTSPAPPAKPRYERLATAGNNPPIVEKKPPQEAAAVAPRRRRAVRARAAWKKSFHRRHHGRPNASRRHHHGRAGRRYSARHHVLRHRQGSHDTRHPRSHWRGLEFGTPFRTHPRPF